VRGSKSTSGGTSTKRIPRELPKPSRNGVRIPLPTPKRLPLPARKAIEKVQQMVEVIEGILREAVPDGILNMGPNWRGAAPEEPRTPSTPQETSPPAPDDGNTRYGVMTPQDQADTRDSQAVLRYRLGEEPSYRDLLLNEQKPKATPAPKKKKKEKRGNPAREMMDRREERQEKKEKRDAREAEKQAERDAMRDGGGRERSDPPAASAPPSGGGAPSGGGTQSGGGAAPAPSGGGTGGGAPPSGTGPAPAPGPAETQRHRGTPSKERTSRTDSSTRV
jgi:hypothetical protein